MRHGNALDEYIRSCHVGEPRTVLEIGSGAGGILKALQEAYKADVLGIEPTPSEAEFASRQGIPTKVGLIEEVGLVADRKFDLVICTQTFNHLLDPRGVAARVSQVLAPGGVFLVECQDFFELCRFTGRRSKAIQIDHTHMFVVETLTALLEQSGLDVLANSIQSDARLSGYERRRHRRLQIPFLHNRMLARRADRAAPPVPCNYAAVRARLMSIPDNPLSWRLNRRMGPHLARLDRWRDRFRPS